jgi:hypothetical protein
MDSTALSQQFANVKTPAAFFDLMLVLQHWPQPELFEALFAIASDCRAHPWPAYAVAADLLASLDPRCPITCREAIVRLGRAHSEASLQSLPFYLVTQFGKHHVVEEIESFIAASDLSDTERQAATTVRYWSQRPASGLLGHYYSRWYHCEQPKDS